MTKALLPLLLLFPFLLNAQQFTVATYNMRYNMPDHTNKDSRKGISWEQRSPVIASMIQFHEIDIIGTQECLNYQLEELSGLLPEYNYYGIGRDDGQKAGEFNAIFYKKDKFKLISKGTFWLSETPEQPSFGWGVTCCHRICTWCLFQENETGKQFYFFNTHYNYRNDLARNESSKLVLARIEEIVSSNPVILMGDLNGDNNSEWYELLANSEKLKDTYNEVENPYVNNGSFNGFGKRNTSKRIIDHIFVSGHFKTNKWGILTDTYHGKFPSDHFPVLTKLELYD